MPNWFRYFPFPSHLKQFNVTYTRENKALKFPWAHDFQDNAGFTVRFEHGQPGRHPVQL